MSAPKSFAVGLIGRGIGNSGSPMIHEEEARALGLSLTYRLFDFDRLDFADDALANVLTLLSRCGYAGVNITHPFKQAVIAHLDEVDDTASALGAVNCVRFEDGRKIGFNSDWVGFAWMIESQLPGVSTDVVAQLGAGGAGSATAFAMLTGGTRELRLSDLNAASMEALAERLRASFPAARIVCAASVEALLDGADGLIQTTPIGMDAHPGCPIDPALLTGGQWVADVIYFPRETELVLSARARGLNAIGGEAMAVGQAVLPFSRFTGHEPDPARMMRAFRDRDAAQIEVMS